MLMFWSTAGTILGLEIFTFQAVRGWWTSR